MGARVLEVADGFAANALFDRNGWTDGLPIVPPTPALVVAALDAARLETDRILGVEPVRGLAITAGKVAVNAVMAGCRPADLAVVAAAVEAMCEPAPASGCSTTGRSGATGSATSPRRSCGRSTAWPRWSAGYLSTDKAGNGAASRTAVALTSGGRAALDAYTQALRDLLQGL